MKLQHWRKGHERFHEGVMNALCIPPSYKVLPLLYSVAQIFLNRNECGDDRKGHPVIMVWVLGLLTMPSMGTEMVFMAMVPAPTPKPTITPGGDWTSWRPTKCSLSSSLTQWTVFPTDWIELRSASETLWTATLATTIPGEQKCKALYTEGSTLNLKELYLEPISVLTDSICNSR